MRELIEVFINNPMPTTALLLLVAVIALVNLHVRDIPLTEQEEDEAEETRFYMQP